LSGDNHADILKPGWKVSQVACDKVVGARLKRAFQKSVVIWINTNLQSPMWFHHHRWSLEVFSWICGFRARWPKIRPSRNVPIFVENFLGNVATESQACS